MTRLASLGSAGGVAARPVKLKMPAKNRAFTFRIWAALEIKSWKSAKRSAQPRSPGRERVHSIEDTNGFEDHAAYNLQALGAEFVDRVLRRVPEDVVVAISEINEVSASHTSFHKWNVIVTDFVVVSEKMRLVPQALCRLTYDVFQPRGGIQIAINVEIGVADHIGQQECFNLFESSVALPLLGQMSDAIKAVVLKRHFLGKTTRAVRFHRFLGIVPDQPYAVTVAGPPAQLIGNFQQQSAGGTAIVGADVGSAAQRVVRVVVAGHDDDAVLFAGKFGNDVVHRELAFRRVGSEIVVLDQIAFQAGGDVVLDLLVIRTAQRARAEFYNLFYVLQGAIAVEGGRRPAVRSERAGCSGGVSRGRGRGRSLALRGILVVIAGEDRQHTRQQHPAPRFR